VITLDGKRIATAIKDAIKSELAGLPESRRPGLGTIIVGDDPASQTYVAGKHRDCAEVGIRSLRVDLPSDASDSEINAAIDGLNRDPHCTGFIVQLPIPGRESISFLERIDPEKDCDGLNPINLGRLLLDEHGIYPCTPLGILTLLRSYEIDLEGVRVAIVGRGITVGRPLAMLLSSHHVNASISIVHSKTVDPESIIRQADVVIVAIGRKWFLKPSMIKPGATVVDVGLTRIDGKLYGDVDPSVADVAGALSPVPGGVGPMTRAMLLDNIMQIHRRNSSR
jgi:methylenetetrahydrofolate dehydrogenase (NADP+)/methenyltetrahydrofolate cyclohydrolase